MNMRGMDETRRLQHNILNCATKSSNYLTGFEMRGRGDSGRRCLIVYISVNPRLIEIIFIGIGSRARVV